MAKIDPQTFFPALKTERLLLRQMTIEDTDFVFRHFSDAAVNQYLLDEPPVTTVAQAREIIQFYLEPEGKTHNRWIMVRKSDQQPIGTCGFHKWDKRYFRAEIGYDLSPAFWRQGYMLEAVIPWQDLDISPTPGLVLGLALNANDNDTPGTAVQEVMKSHVATRAFQDPTSWGTLTLR